MGQRSFTNPMVQRDFTDAEADPSTGTGGPVECLGMTFENDDARRAYFLEKLREKLQDPEFRKIEGFPTGKDEDILALSDPPYYTACPNPFIEDFIRQYGRPYDPDEPYHREPFAVDVSEGKNDPIYDAHSYHTKVPHKAIMRYILHYTRPGDIVLDGFCGTGMTGVAAQMCADHGQVEFLGYKVSEEHQSTTKTTNGLVEVGSRSAILTDLSPIATFIARNLLAPVDATEFIREARRVRDYARQEVPWLYKTRHTLEGTGGETVEGEILYSVWSDIFICSECASEMLAWDVVVDREQVEMKGEFDCPYCGTFLRRRSLEKSMVTSLDPVTGSTYRHTKQAQVLIHYMIGSQRFQKAPDMWDAQTSTRAEEALKHYQIPTCSFEHTSRHLKDGNHLRGITHSHHFYTPRNLLALAVLQKHIRASKYPLEMNFVFTGFLEGHANRRNRYIVDRNHPQGTTCGPLTNTLFVPELQSEVNVFNVWEKTLKKQAKAKSSRMVLSSLVQVRSATSLGLPDSSVDYIFVDPPFGKNILYSDLNLLWEAWLGVQTQPEEEAIVNDKQRKGLAEYGDLISEAFTEFHRVLKPGRWMTLEFHNSLNAVWSSIQEALLRAGFVVADVRVLDKKHGTIHQDSGYTVKQDLIVSAYRPNSEFENRFKLQAGTEEGAWDFVRAHLKQLPVFVQAKDGKVEVVAERQGYMLFDRMVAFHVQRGVTVPMSASEFYAGLSRRFPERDSMYFLTEQVAEYERKRMTVREVQQLELFVSNEASAIQWLRQQLTNKPQTLQELTPQFMPETMAWQKHELRPELRDLLEESFLSYEGQGPIPPQIASWLKKSAELRELIEKTGREREDGSLETDDNVLKARARDRWYVPDPNRAIDLEKLRLKGLLKEFATYSEGKGRLKQFRTEAVRAGFAQAYNQNNYAAIIEVASRLPESVVEEDPNLMMYVDIARLRVQE